MKKIVVVFILWISAVFCFGENKHEITLSANTATEVGVKYQYHITDKLMAGVGYDNSSLIFPYFNYFNINGRYMMTDNLYLASVAGYDFEKERIMLEESIGGEIGFDNLTVFVEAHVLKAYLINYENTYFFRAVGVGVKIKF